MKKVIRITESQLRRIIENTINESDVSNLHWYYEDQSKKLKRGIHELFSMIENGDKESAMQMMEPIMFVLKNIDQAVYDISKKSKNENKPLNESVLLTLGGIALGGAIIKNAYDYLKNRELKGRMTPTGEIKKSLNGKYVMKQYRDNKSGELFWGIDVTDSTRDEGFRERNILLFKDDNPKKIESILNYYEKNPGHMDHFNSDEERMKDDYKDKFGPYKADKRIYMGKD